jgi:hypothetical protein
MCPTPGNLLLYTWKIDQALPRKHTLRLYGALTSDQAAILIQARTGRCRLNEYLSRTGIVDEGERSYGSNKETIGRLSVGSYVQP